MRHGHDVIAQLEFHRDINFVINAEPSGFGQQFARAHGPSACAMAFRVKDAGKAYAKAIEQNPGDAQTWNNRGVCLWKMNRIADARIEAVDSDSEGRPQ